MSPRLTSREYRGGVQRPWRHRHTHGGSPGTCTWTVTGHLSVRGPTLDGIEDGAPLAGVEVKVSGADRTGTHFNAFGKWGVDYTNAKGEFSVTHTECSKRRVRVEAKFVSKSGDLRVLGKGSKTWYVLRDTNSLKNAGPIDLGDEPFGGETGDQATGQARTRRSTRATRHGPTRSCTGSTSPRRAPTAA